MDMKNIFYRQKKIKNDRLNFKSTIKKHINIMI